ncbi:MAG: hypothetical protein ACOCV4_02640 [Myxococcota bacterium]
MSLEGPSGGGSCVVVAVAGLLLLLCSAGPARAQTPLTANDFEIDGYTGPVLGPGRIVGLGGAYTAIATGIDAAPFNPAAYGTRELYDLDWFEYGLTAGVLLPGLFSRNDYFNNDQGDGIGVDNFVFLNFGFRLQFGPAGVGGVINLQRFQAENDTDTVDVSFNTGHYGGAWAFMDGQLVVGAGLRTAAMDMTLPDGTTLVSFTGTGPEAGGVLGLEGQPWRAGVSVRLPVDSKPSKTDEVETVDGVRQVRGFVLPRKVHLPWEVQLGFAWQLGDRPLNKRWEKPTDPAPHLRRELRWEQCRRELLQVHDEHREQGRPMPAGASCPDLAVHPQSETWWRAEHRRRAAEQAELERRIEAEEDLIEERRDAAVEALPRNYWLITTGLLFVGSTEDGVGFDGFLDQERRTAGRNVSVGVRAGVETEPWTNRLKVRAGFYLEPARHSGVNYRPHGTMGFDLRLFRWDLFGWVDDFDFKVGFTADLAPRYYDFGIGMGFWH